MKVAPCTTSWILLAGMIAAGLFVAVPALSDDGDDDEPAMGKCDSDCKDLVSDCLAVCVYELCTGYFFRPLLYTGRRQM